MAAGLHTMTCRRMVKAAIRWLQVSIQRLGGGWSRQLSDGCRSPYNDLEEDGQGSYTIIYIWRMLEGQVPCINSLDSGAKVKSIWHIRRGRDCQIPCINHHSPRNIQALKHATLAVRGQQLFNTLPRDIRNMTGCKVDMFKRRLDKYLSTIPDEP